MGLLSARFQPEFRPVENSGSMFGVPSLRASFVRLRQTNMFETFRAHNSSRIGMAQNQSYDVLPENGDAKRPLAGTGGKEISR